MAGRRHKLLIIRWLLPVMVCKYFSNCAGELSQFFCYFIFLKKSIFKLFLSTFVGRLLKMDLYFESPVPPSHTQTCSWLISQVSALCISWGSALNHKKHTVVFISRSRLHRPVPVRVDRKKACWIALAILSAMRRGISLSTHSAVFVTGEHCSRRPVSGVSDLASPRPASQCRHCWSHHFYWPSSYSLQHRCRFCWVRKCDSLAGDSLNFR